MGALCAIGRQLVKRHPVGGDFFARSAAVRRRIGNEERHHGNQLHRRKTVAGGVPIKMWTRGVPVEDEAKRQLANAARLPIVFKHIAAMPDVHFGIGATVGSVIPTFKAIIPAAVGRRHRLRHDRLQDHAARRGPAGQPGAAALGDRARGAARPRAGRARPGRLEQGAGLGGHAPGRSSSPSSPSSAATTRSWPRPTTAATWARWARGNHFIEVCLDEAGLRLVHAALGLARRRQRDRHDVHRAGQAGRACATTPTCPTATWRTSRKARATSATTCAPSAGRRSSRRSTAR